MKNYIWLEGLSLKEKCKLIWEKLFNAKVELMQTKLSLNYWGVIELSIDRSALADAQFSILACDVVMPNFQTVHFGGRYALSCKLEQSCSVYLNLPFQHIIFGLSKLTVTTQMVKDCFQVKIAEINKSRDENFYINEGYIPPLTHIRGAASLTALLEKLLVFIDKAIEQLRSIRQQTPRDDLQNMLNFACLQSLCEADVEISLLLSFDQHPAAIYKLLVKLEYQLQIFNQCEPVLTQYNHNYLSTCFHRLDLHLRYLVDVFLKAASRQGMDK